MDTQWQRDAVRNIRASDDRFSGYLDDEIVGAYREYSDLTAAAGWLSTTDFKDFIAWAFVSPMDRWKQQGRAA